MIRGPSAASRGRRFLRRTAALGAAFAVSLFYPFV
ncbi:MAG: twin-arginine translocation signal domain-containing protein [Nitrospira sp. CR1.1]|nr:twin-arginine translocation signal domain-containing protein [Nitrospira sp. CR1.1]